MFIKNIFRTFRGFTRITIHNQGQIRSIKPKNMQKTSLQQLKVISVNSKENSTDQSPEAVLINKEIMIQQSLTELLEIYHLNQNDFSLINHCTFINKAVKLQNKSIQSITLDEVRQSIIVIEQNIHLLNSFGLTNFIYNLAKLNYLDKTLLQKILHIVVNDNIVFAPKGYSYLIWSLNHFKLQHQTDILDHISKQLLNQDQFTTQDIANIFWSLSELNYKNMPLFRKLEKLIIIFSQEFDSTQLNLIFQAFSKSYPSNIDIFDALSGRIMKLSNQMSIRNISNMLNYFSRLKYANQAVIDILCKQIIVQQKTEQLTAQDASQIIMSLCKLKSIQQELFAILEESFIQQIDTCNPRSISTFAFAHSQLSLEIIHTYGENKRKLLKRSLKNVKKYNDCFYEIICPHVLQKIDEFKPEEIQSIMISATKPQIKKRALCRYFLDIGLQSLPQIIKTSDQRIIYQQYKLVQKFVFKQDQLENINEKFEELGVNLKELEFNYSHLLVNNKLISNEVNNENQEMLQ